MNIITPDLHQLGWRPFFAQQLTLEELNHFSVGRIIAHHRSRIIAACKVGEVILNQNSKHDKLCVGDWVLFDSLNNIIKRLDRYSIFERKSPGTKITNQLIAANIDSLVIVCALNQDFNLNRIERYIAIAHEAQVDPIVVLTKTDLCNDVAQKQSSVQALDPFMPIYALNALDNTQLHYLENHCQPNQTIAFLGSSGVGKSTIVNGLLGYQALETGSIRQDDGKGKHTTTHRALKFLPQGAILMDTPGMRELQLTQCQQGVNETFSEIIELTQQCRFNDCQHNQEPGCAVNKALIDGMLDERRYNSYLKLQKEQAFNSMSLSNRKANEKSFGKMIHRVQNEAKKRKRGE